MKKKRNICKIVSFLLTFTLVMEWLPPAATALAADNTVETASVERPTAKGVDGDATGDGFVNSKDIVREKKELAGKASKLSTTDAFLSGKSYLRDEDVISLYEIILRKDSRGYPIYLEDDKIMLAAYEGPRKANRQDFTWDGSNLTSAPVTQSYLNATEFKRFADAGLNTVYAQGDAQFWSTTMGDADAAYLYYLNNYMKLAEDAGIDVIVYTEALNSYLRGNDVTKVDAAGTTVTHSELKNSVLEADLRELWEGGTAPWGYGSNKGMKEWKNFAGLMMSDELEYDCVDNYTTALEKIKGISSDIAYYSSQFSMAASGTHFGGSALDTSAAKRAENFVKAAKAFGNAAGKFTYDMYPLLKDGSVEDYWLYNLELSAQTAKENGFETGITLQSTDVEKLLSAASTRVPDQKDDIGFQVYTALAYGMKSITYYTYWEHHNQNTGITSKEVYTTPMVTYPDDPNAEGAEGQETDVYYAVQGVNNEINKFDHVFMEYDWQGTIPLEVNDEDNLYDYLDTSYINSRIASKTVNGGDALIGCMYDDNQEKDGFWLVNACNPEDDKTSTVTIKFNDTEKLMVFDPQAEGFDGTGEVVDYDSVNGYTASLASGTGQFVIPMGTPSEPDVIVEDDGSITLRNSAGEKRVEYICDTAVTKDQILSFDLEVTPSQKVAVWVIDESNNEHIANEFVAWDGTKTFTTTFKADSDNFKILVEYRGDTELKDNVLKISNVKVSEPDVSVAEDGTVTLRNSAGNNAVEYQFMRDVKAGQKVRFDLEVTPSQSVAVRAFAWYEHLPGAFEMVDGKTTFTTDAFTKDADNFKIQVKFDGSVPYEDNVVKISNVKIIEPDVVVGDDGSVTLRNSTGKNAVEYQFIKNVKAGQKVRFDLEVAPSQSVAVRAFAWYEHLPGTFEMVDGKTTFTTDAFTKDADNFKIQVKFDGSVPYEDNVVKISNVQIEDVGITLEDVVIENPTGAQTVSHQFIQDVKAGDTITFDLEVEPSQQVAVWLIAWNEYIANTFTWDGKKTFSVTMKQDTDNFRIQIRYDGGAPYDGNIIKISNIKITPAE